MSVWMRGIVAFAACSACSAVDVAPNHRSSPQLAEKSPANSPSPVSQEPELTIRMRENSEPIALTGLARQRVLAKMEKRAELLRAYADRRRLAPLDPSRHASAAFYGGFKLANATIHLSHFGCVVEIEQGGHTYGHTFHEFPSCRLAERGDQGHADVRSVQGRTGRGLLLVHVEKRDYNHFCRLLIQTIRITPTGPRIAKKHGEISLCTFFDLDDLHYEVMSSDDVAMKKLP